VTADARLRRIVVAVLGLIAFGGVVAWFGIVQPRRDKAPPVAAATPNEEPATQITHDKAARDAGQSAAPSFDVVRVEPSGESVIAGRSAPGATIEMLRNGKSHDRGMADASGLFALVPPPLPPGSHEIVLQAIAPDGTRTQSRQSVTVVVDASGKAQPLVTLTSPDRPTVVLSSPQYDSKMAAAPTSSGASTPPGARAPAQQAAGQGAGPRPPVKIVTVEAEEGGRLFVSGNAAPGATVRLYLNETFIAPGGAAADGGLSFAIGRGVRPGDYRVRLDDVDPVSGDVRSRAEVSFNVPLTVAAAQPDARTAAAGSTGTSPAALAAAPEAARRAAPSATASVAGSPARIGDAGAVVVPEVNTAVVGRGDNLWRISKRVYGIGQRYTVIYDANQAQIRNPNYIYPGQVFVVPPERSP
jgi:nucleoid-associated protein YgaU